MLTRGRMRHAELKICAAIRESECGAVTNRAVLYLIYEAMALGYVFDNVYHLYEMKLFSNAEIPCLVYSSVVRLELMLRVYSRSNFSVRCFFLVEL